MKNPARLFSLLILLVAYPALTLAQGFKIEGKSPAATAGSETFTSQEGRFTISLPKQISAYSPVAGNTPNGRIAGSTFHWATAEGAFIVGYIDGPKAVETDGKPALDVLRNGILEAGKGKANLISETDISLDGHPGRELKLEFPDGFSTMRIYLVGNRIYEEIASLATEKKSQEPAAIKILDSFKLLTQADIEASLKRKIAEATPSTLPQEPVAKRPRSDAEDDGLKGKVKTVFSESEDLSGTWAVKERKPSSMEYYNELGNLTKRDSYDYRGNPSDITVYGYLDGDRVSNSKSIEYEYNPPPMMIATPAGEPKPKYDPRYSYKLKFKYDGQGRLAEEDWYGNEGKLWLRYVYSYKGNQKEELVYSADGSLNQKYLYTLDNKGNDAEEIIYETKGNAVKSKYSYSYEFDSQGNWTKRTTSKLVTKDGKSFFEPSYLTYHTITYY